MLQGRDHREGLQTFLRSHRMTPHASTGVAPAKLMLRYEPRTKLPGIERWVRSKDMRLAQEKDRRSKVEMKKRYDRIHHTKFSELKPGDIVVQRQEKKDKFTSRFDCRPFKIIRKNGNVVVIERDGAQYKRNVSRVKKVRVGFGAQRGNATGGYCEHEGGECFERTGERFVSNEEQDVVGVGDNQVVLERQTNEEEQSWVMGTS